MDSLRDKVMFLVKDKNYKPITGIEISYLLNIERNDLKSVKKVLKTLEKEGVIFKNNKEQYVVFKGENLIIGKISLTSKGYAFLIPDDGSEDIFIPPGNIKGAMNDDRVAVKILKRTQIGKRREGEVIKIIDRANNTYVGVYQDNKNFGFVIPDDKKMPYDIYISSKDKGGAITGNLVLVKLIKWPENDKKPEGKIIEVIGNRGEKGVDIKLIIKKYNLPDEFPDKVIKFAENFDNIISENDIEGRLDLRNERIITIDGSDAKDLDDAVIVQKLPSGNYKLGVHIADVSHYVKEKNPLDREAYKRGTSVYLIDYVIPMLPKKLSNGICSLNPDVDRLALSCMMEIDNQGKVVNYDIKESVIRSKARMTYEDVTKILKGDEELSIKYKDLIGDFKLMEDLCIILRQKRMKRGAIDFDLKECKIKLDENGKPIEIKAYDREISNMIIEEFMLCANETIAEHFYWAKVPFVYRVHEDPDPEKLLRFMNFINNLGYSINQKSSEVHPKSLQKILEAVKGKNEEKVVNTLLLRSLQQARYNPECIGHFGLCAKFYCHFTSPIRRYPDLIIHRIIKEFIKSGISEKKQERLEQDVESASIQSSITERKAEEAEREVDDVKKAEYMADRIGEEYEGIISSVTGFGFFVELYNTIEGLVHLEELKDDLYYFDEENLTLRGYNTNNMFKLGDKIRVRVKKVNVLSHEIYFEIFYEDDENGFKITKVKDVLV